MGAALLEAEDPVGVSTSPVSAPGGREEGADSRACFSLLLTRSKRCLLPSSQEHFLALVVY